jgi:hypothetical protein
LSIPTGMLPHGEDLPASVIVAQFLHWYIRHQLPRAAQG